MKILVVLLLIVGLAIYLGIGYMDRGLSTQRYDMYVAFGDPGEQGIEFNVTLTEGMTEREPPAGNPQFNATWQEWMEAHFKLVDADGQPVAITYLNDSKLIGAKPGSPDVGYLRAYLSPGSEYTLHYTPVSDQPTVGRGVFTAPDRRKEAFLLKVVAGPA
ncbi:MAG: hypothetical protein C4547_07580 [Phycisphaerales bacterium]|nr:MAG: hypothetical protein C4547_07580 [Phycisphaerales bacterium]